MTRPAEARHRPPAGLPITAAVAAARSDRSRWLLIAAIIVLTAAVYWPVHGYDFVSMDDPIYATDNPFLRGGVTSSSVPAALASTYAHFWQPLALLSLMADMSVFVSRPGALHMTNLLLHLVQRARAVLAALADDARALGAAAFVAALFALHPLHVESVAWIANARTF